MDGYPIDVTIPVAWGDMDALGHVNNTIYFRWFETARIIFFERVGWMKTGEVQRIGPILARTQAVFRAPVHYPDTVVVGTRASDFGPDRFTMHFRVERQADGAVVCEGDGRIVSFDYEAGNKAPLPESIRAAILQLA